VNISVDVLEEKLADALRRIRVGDYDAALAILDLLRGSQVEATFRAEPDASDFAQLRLATLLAEAAEYKGKYDEQKKALDVYDPDERLIADLRDIDLNNDSFDFSEYDRLRQRFVRQQLYYLWQRSVWEYRSRHGSIAKSRELLDLALRLANRLAPRSSALLTQLYYGAGKLAFHDCDEAKSIAMYRQSLMSASHHLDVVHGTDDDEVAPKSSVGEEEAAQYSVAKTLALGLGQSLREQGRLEEAHTQVIAGRLLLNIGADTELSHYARLLLGSIERSMAGENQDPELLERAQGRIEKCEQKFRDHPGEIGYRARLELALVMMQKQKLEKAREMLETIVQPPATGKWIAEGNIGLSRVARRSSKHDEAIKFADKAVEASEIKRIKRRAQTVLVLALYDGAVAATNPVAKERLLDRTLTEIEKALDPKKDPDVRTRANMLLTRTRVERLKGQIAQALHTFEEFKILKPAVEVGRIHELAKVVEKELAEMDKPFVCPADYEPPDFDLDKNIDALRKYVRRKATARHPRPGDLARALNRSRTGLYPKKGTPEVDE